MYGFINGFIVSFINSIFSGFFNGFVLLFCPEIFPRVFLSRQKTELVRSKGVSVFEKAQGVGAAGCCGKVHKEAVHRADQRQELFGLCLCNVLKFIKCPSLLQGELSDAGAKEGLHGCACAEGFSQILTEGTDVGSFGAADAHGDQRKLYLFDVQGVDGDTAGFALHRDSLAGHIVQPFPVHFYCGVHGRDLVDLTCKCSRGFPDSAVYSVFCFFFCSCFWISFFGFIRIQYRIAFCIFFCSFICIQFRIAFCNCCYICICLQEDRRNLFLRDL